MSTQESPDQRFDLGPRTGTIPGAVGDGPAVAGGAGCADRDASGGKRKDPGKPASETPTVKAGAWSRPAAEGATSRAEGPHPSPPGFPPGTPAVGRTPRLPTPTRPTE